MRTHRLISLSAVSQRPRLVGLLLGGALLGGLALDGCSFSLSERAVCTDMGCIPIANNDGSTNPPRPDMAVYQDDPDKPGPFLVTTQEQATPPTVNMAGDKVTLVLPSDDGTQVSSKQPSYPLVLFLPANTVSPQQLKGYAERLASHGIASALVKVANESNHDQYRTNVAQLLYFLTGDQASTYKDKLDKGKVGVVGHQLGGKIALGLLLNNGSAVHAALGLDPVNVAGFFDGLSDLRNVDINGRKPIALLGEPLSKPPPPGLSACTPEDKNYEKFYEAYQGSAVAITFPGATMPDFAGTIDPTCGTATMTPATTMQLAVKYAAAYFQWTLLGKQRAREHLLGADFNLDKTTYGLTSVSK